MAAQQGLRRLPGHIPPPRPLDFPSAINLQHRLTALLANAHLPRRGSIEASAAKRCERAIHARHSGVEKSFLRPFDLDAALLPNGLPHLNARGSSSTRAEHPRPRLQPLRPGDVRTYESSSLGGPGAAPLSERWGRRYVQGSSWARQSHTLTMIGLRASEAVRTGEPVQDAEDGVDVPLHAGEPGRDAALCVEDEQLGPVSVDRGGTVVHPEVKVSPYVIEPRGGAEEAHVLAEADASVSRRRAGDGGGGRRRGRRLSPRSAPRRPGPLPRSTAAAPRAS